MDTNTPKVTIQKPSDEIIKAANEIEYVVAGTKRIGLKKPGPLAQYDIVEVVGDSAKNEVYMNMVMPLTWVCEIDGDPVSLPSTKRELRALIQRLDTDGINAIATHLQTKVAAPESEELTKN